MSPDNKSKTSARAKTAPRASGNRTAARSRAQIMRERERRRKARIRNLIYAAVALIMLAVVIVLLVGLGGSGDKPVITPTSAPTPTFEPTPTPTPEPTPAPTLDPYTLKELEYEAATAHLRPTAEQGMLPVFKHANTNEKMIAITIDDLNEVNNLKAILDLCEAYGAKITLFPIGDNADRCATQLKRALEMDCEIENHTNSHVFHYKLEDAELAYEIHGASQAISRALEMEYQPHFFRPTGGNGTNDPRLHAYLTQLGYKGIAHWSLSGSNSASYVLSRAQAGDIILYHSTSDDLKNLRSVIPGLVEQGYKLVTLNTLLGYFPNRTGELTSQSAQGQLEIISAPYTYDGITYTHKTRMYGVKLFQKRLIELNYLLPNNADGDYGEMSVEAVKMFQTDAGLPVTGDADMNTRARAMSEDAPVNTLPAVGVTPKPIK